MTHTRQLDDDEGTFSPAETLLACRRCGQKTVSCRKWESHDGAYEDYQYRCMNCGFIWWVDGIDA